MEVMTVLQLVRDRKQDVGIARMASSRNVVVSAERVDGVDAVELFFSPLGCLFMVTVALFDVDALPSVEAEGIDV